MTETTAPVAPRIDDPAFLAGDPFPWYRELRARPGLHRDDAAGLWVATRVEQVVALSRDPETFCSARGVLPSDRARDIMPRESILYLDPPEHGKYRRLVQPAFSPGRLRALETRIRATARSLVAVLPEGEPFDMVAALSAPLPLVVIAEMLGVPDGDRARFRIWSDAIIEAGTRQTPENMAMAAELMTYFAGVLGERRARPGEDLLSALAVAEVDGERLEDLDILLFCLTLLVAGNETTRNLISHGTEALATWPDEIAPLRADPALVPRAVEEMLRWGSPISGFMRTATRAVSAFGADIREGDRVLMVYAAANRDEAVFGADAEIFRASRDASGHVAFGFGEHFCLGAALARMEGRIVFEELLARFGRLELAAPAQRLESNVMRGIERLPIAARG